MDHNDFGGAVIPAMAGFLFWKRAKVQEIRHEPVQQLPSVISTGSVGVTGVAKYIATLPLVTGVTKYVKKQEKNQISGVEKYLLKQAIADKAAPVATGVSKYIANTNKDAEKRKKSGVDKYLLKLDFAEKQQASLTGVAKYKAEQDLIERKKVAAAMIERYREEENQAAAAAKESAQLSYQDAVEHGLDLTEEVAKTGLGRYLQSQAKKPKNSKKATGVAKYIAKQIILDSQKPALSGVSKYLRKQSLSTVNNPVLTGVAKYISRQPQSTVTVKKEHLAQSGVSKYLANLAQSESGRPVITGVAKYLDKKNKLESAKPKLALVHQDEQVEKCLEGEFIPANQADVPLTGVAKYLDKQNSLSKSVVVEKAGKIETTNRLSGVSRYIAKNADELKQNRDDVAAENLTGVDRYLKRRA